MGHREARILMLDNIGGEQGRALVFRQVGISKITIATCKPLRKYTLETISTTRILLLRRPQHLLSLC